MASMFGFLCSRRRLSYKSMDLLFSFNGVMSLSSLKTTPPLSCFLSNRFISGDNSSLINEKHVCYSYLIDICGLSPQQAISVSKKLQHKSLPKPNLVISLFKTHEFPDTHISKIIVKCPLLLLADADKTLKPKLEFFNSIGLSGSDLSNIISTNPQILNRSLENAIKPVIDVIRSIVGTKSNVITVIRRSFWLIKSNPQKWMVPNIALLRSYGVPDSNISKHLLRSPCTLWTASRMNEILDKVKKLKFDPARYEFVKAIDVLLSVSKASWEAKIDIYKRWGWSEEEIYMAFTKQTQCMRLSKKKIMGTMEFIVNKMGYDPLLCAKYPLILMLSLEKRVIPRLLVLRVLISGGLIRKDFSIYTLLCMTDEKFKENFLKKFVEKVPELLDVYHGKIKVV